MNKIKSDSGEISNVKSFRITDHDAMVIKIEHGSLSNFLNEAIAKEVKRIKRKKSVKSKSK